MHRLTATMQAAKNWPDELLLSAIADETDPAIAAILTTELDARTDPYPTGLAGILARHAR